MNLFDKLSTDCLQKIYENLDNKQLYIFAHTYKTRGYTIERLIKYIINDDKINEKFDIDSCCEDFYNSCKCHDRGQLNKYKKIINFDNNNIPFLSKFFELRYFSKDIKQNKNYVLKFIESNYYENCHHYICGYE